MSAALLQLRGDTLRYGHVAVLQDVHLRIQPGERIALLGKSGAGKSTLLRVLFQQVRHQAALCSQENALVPLLSVYHNLYMGRLDQHGTAYNLINLLRPWPEEVAKVRDIAQLLGIDELLFRACETLSGGQQQRVALGRALIQQRPVFFGDEPVSAVDENQARQLIDLILARHDTVVLALHDVATALTCCQRIIGLQQGRIALDAPAASLNPDDLIRFYQD